MNTGMPDLAAYYAYHDASVDHAGGEGVYGEIFFAVLESLAFVESDRRTLIDAARQSILDKYAGDNFTYAPVNIAFTLMGWLYEQGFTAQMLTTLNCGYDTDCTVATLGSLLGILHGTAYIDPQWTQPLGERILVSRPITGFAAPKTISELTDRTLAARKLVQEHYAQQAEKHVFAIAYQHDVEVHILPKTSHKAQDLTVTVKIKDGCPAFAPGETGEIRIHICNHQSVGMQMDVEADIPGFISTVASVHLAANGEAEATLSLTAPIEKSPLWQGEIRLTRRFGGAMWNRERIPLTLVPTMDWRMEVDGEVRELRCPTNRVELGSVAPGIRTLRLETSLVLAEDCEAQLLFACKNGIAVSVDGQLRINAQCETVVIPAYHRADRSKCVKAKLGKGAPSLRVEVSNPDLFAECYFMIVIPKLDYAYELGAMCCLP